MLVEDKGSARTFQKTTGIEPQQDTIERGQVRKEYAKALEALGHLHKARESDGLRPNQLTFPSAE
jgi:hypothetical protein